MATKVEPGQRSATLEARTVKRAVAMYLGMTQGVMVAHTVEEGGAIHFTGVTLHADGSAHVTLHDKSPAFKREAEGTVN